MLFNVKKCNKKLILGVLVVVMLLGVFLIHKIDSYAADESWYFTADRVLGDNILGMRYDCEEDEDGDDDETWYMRGVGCTSSQWFDRGYRTEEFLKDVGIVPSILQGDFFSNEALKNWHGDNANINTIKSFTAPYSGYFKVCCNAPKGQNADVSCPAHMLDGSYGSYGSYIQGEVYLNQGETLLIVMGPKYNSDEQHESGSDGSDGYDESEALGRAGSCIYIFKYKDSSNLIPRFNSHKTHLNAYKNRVYNNEILVYIETGDDKDYVLPNADLLMVCGGGNGASSYCDSLSRDTEKSGVRSGFYYDSSNVRHFYGIQGAYSDIGKSWSDSDSYVGFSEVSEDGIEYDGYYKDADGNVIPVSRFIYDNGNKDNSSWVMISSVGNYVFYEENAPSGCTVSGTMLATRISRGMTGVLRENTFSINDDWEFAGWATSEVRADEGIVDYLDEASIGPLTEDITLYAVWKPSNWVLSYDSNKPSGATSDVVGSMPSKEVPNNTGCTIDDNKFSLTGYSFIGWSTSPNGSKEYDNKGIISPRSSDLTLYGLWSANSYDVNIYNNKPSDATSNIQNIK